LAGWSGIRLGGENNVLGFRRHQQVSVKQCEHPKALPRWDRVEDSGNPDRISSLYCPDCDKFLPLKSKEPASTA
jgi:hypothetical protein